MKILSLFAVMTTVVAVASCGGNAEPKEPVVKAEQYVESIAKVDSFVKGLVGKADVLDKFVVSIQNSVNEFHTVVPGASSISEILKKIAEQYKLN